MFDEIWQIASGFKGYYEVSNFGRIRTIPRVTTGLRKGRPHTQRRPGKVLSPYLNHAGYLTVKLKIGTSRKSYLVHRLIARTFVKGYHKELTVNHISGIKTDNRPSNLEWVTLSRNSQLQWRDGLIDLRGEKHPLAKLSDDETRNIDRLLKAGHPVKELSEQFGVSDGLIYKIMRGAKPVLPETLNKAA